MDERTTETQEEMLEALEDELGLRVTQMDITEYIHGDPTDENAVVGGAEVRLTAYISLDEPESAGSDFRYEPE